MRPAYLKQMSIITILTLLLWPLTVHASWSHEVLPSIADITLDRKTVKVEIRLISEAILADIDLENVTDTEGAPNEDEYDLLRALEPERLKKAFRQNWPELETRISLRDLSSDRDQRLTLSDVRVDPVGDMELPRFTYITFTTIRATNDPVVFSWDSKLGPIILRQQGLENGLTEYLAPGQISSPISSERQAQKSGWAVFFEYIPVGFDHIIPKGLDHVLFVVGLYFLSLKLSVLLWQITSFTLAHTVTLTAAAFGVITLPASMIEPLIAASIVFVAVENCFAQRLSKWRPIIIFGFGLLHGLGFASVLSAFGLPDLQFIPALLGFNLGVELGQIAVVFLAFILLGYWFGEKSWYRSRITVPASVLIAAVGSWWFLERTILA